MILLGDIRVVHGVSPETESDQQVVQIQQCRQSHAWFAKLHPETGDRVQHPSRHYRDDARRHFDMNRLTSDSLFAVFPTQPVAHKVDANDSERLLPARHGQNDPEIALGRRNALFAGSPRGAEAWAILASIINTAKLHELDPQTYLADVLEKMVSGQTKVSALHELLPWTWKAAWAAQMGAAA